MLNKFSNRATWLMANNFESSSNRVYTNYLIANTSKELQKIFMKYAAEMDNCEELLDLRNEINWEEILGNKE